MIENEEICLKNREDAAYKLLEVLPKSMCLEEWIVVASSYGGYPLAKIIAEKLNSQYEIMFSEKIVAPNNEECEIAIITEQEEVLIHEELVKSFGIKLDYVYSKSTEIYKKNLIPRIKKFRDGGKIQDFKDKNVLIVDEGINTGLTMMACIKTAINLKAKSVSVATPILPSASIPTIESIADDLYYIKNLDHFITVAFYYDELPKMCFKDIEKNK